MAGRGHGRSKSMVSQSAKMGHWGSNGWGGVIGLFESGKSIFSKTTEDEGKPFGRMKGLS